MLGTCPVTLDWVWGGWAQLQSQELMGCVYFILAGDTAKVGGEPGRDLLGQWAQAWPSFLL